MKLYKYEIKTNSDDFRTSVMLAFEKVPTASFK